MSILWIDKFQIKLLEKQHKTAERLCFEFLNVHTLHHQLIHLLSKLHILCRLDPHS